MAIVYCGGEPGKVCTYCKTWKPIDLFYKSSSSNDGYRPDCKPCILYRQRQRYNEKRDEILRDRQEYYQRNRRRIIDRNSEYQRKYIDERREYHRNYYWRNLEQRRRYQKELRNSHLEEYRNRAREHYHNNEDYREFLRAYQREWRKDNRDKVRAAWHRRRAKHRAAGRSFTAEQWSLLKEYYNHTCLCCGRQEPKIKLTPDHVIPLGAPGTGAIANIQPLCLSCNSAKGAKTIDYRPDWDGEAD